MIKRVAFTILPVLDVGRAREFYEQTLGLAVGTTGEHGDIRWVEYDLPGGGCLALTNVGDPKPSADSGATVALEVVDLEASIAGLKERGVTFASDVIRGPRCRMAVCIDSEGNGVLLHELDSPLERERDAKLTALLFNEAINRRDLDGLLDLITDDHDFIDSAGGETRGRDAIAAAWRGFFDKFADYRNDITWVGEVDDRVVAVGRSVCSADALAGPAIWTAAVEGGLVAEWRVHDDTPEVRAELGIAARL